MLKSGKGTVTANGFAMSPSPSPLLFPLLLALFLLSAPRCSVVEAAGGFRLCGLKLTMMLNAICKQQLCGGFIMKKKSSLSPSFANMDNPIESEAMIVDEKEKGQFIQMEQGYLIRHNEVGKDGGQTNRWADDDRRAKRIYPYGAFGTSKKSGIATECCSKRCTLSYMKTYCCTTVSDGGKSGEDEGNRRGEEQ